MNATNDNLRSIKILLALEASPERQEIIEELSKYYNVQVADDCENVYDKVHSFDPDIAILDYSISKLHPIDLHEGISLVHSHLHLVICVNTENLEVAERIWHKRAIDYIIKPYTTKRFLNDVKKVLRYVLHVQEIKKLRKRIKELKKEIDDTKAKGK